MCDVSCDDGSVHILRACVRGNLVELNERLIVQPSLLADDPLGAGIAVLFPKDGDRITGDKHVVQERLNDRLEHFARARQADIDHRESQRALKVQAKDDKAVTSSDNPGAKLTSGDPSDHADHPCLPVDAGGKGSEDA